MRLSFGLAAGPRILVASEADKTKLMDQFLNTILGGDISTSTREMLLKQLDQAAVVSLPAPGDRQAQRAAEMGEMEP